MAYDYIVVGAGSAGCVVASRLSGDPGTRVLLLEAGGPDRPREIHVPAAFARLFKTPLDWAYETEAQPHLNGRRLYWPRGKVLGGSSAINAMIYIRGHPDDYDRWRAAGCTGWGFADVLPYFKRAEHQARGASEHHGIGGPLSVADHRTVNPLSRAFVEAGVEIGLLRNDDFNGAAQEGVGLYQVTQARGRRCSAASAYLAPALRRPNLSLRTHAHATRVLVEQGRAVGVTWIEGTRLERASAEREVILCGGTVNSPQLLMLSGIGRADDLRALDLPVVADLPGVGQNLQDHLGVAVAYECRAPVTLVRAARLPSLLRYLLLRRGPLTSNVAEAGAFLRSRHGLDVPDLQFHFAPNYFLDHGFLNPAGDGFTLGPTALRPESRGEITLRSADPLVPPVIRPRYLASDRDVEVLIEGVALARRLAAAKAFDPFRGEEVWPGRTVQGREAVAEFIRNRVQTLYHPVGTCRMGDDASAVVGADLRVRGVAGLRVVDASVMPIIIGGNTNAPTIMIAERAAGLIRAAP